MQRENRKRGGKMMKATLLSTLTLVALLALVGCTTSPEPTPEAAKLTLKVAVNMDSEGEVVLRFGAHNTGPADFPGDKDFVGKWRLIDEAGDLRASGSLTIMGLLGSGETAFPAEWKGKLVPGAYTLTWDAPGYGLTAVNFTVVEHNGRLSIGEQTTQTFDVPAEGEMVYPLAVEPSEWLEYEVVSASNFQLLPGTAVQQGDRVRFEVVGSGTGKKMGLDMTTAVSFETPLCDAYVNGEKAGEQVGEEGTIAINVIYPVAVEFWQDYQAVEANWNETTAAEGLPYHGEIWVESDVVTVEFGYTEPAVIQVQGRQGPVDVPIERGVTSVTVDRETGVVLEQTRDAGGSQASYHIVLVDSSARGVR
jgi:hypothetical protein